MVCIITLDDGRTFVTTYDKIDAVMKEIEDSSIAAPIDIHVKGPSDYFEISREQLVFEPQTLD